MCSRCNQDGSLSLTDGLQIHLLELPKYSIPSDDEVILEPVDEWFYFFRRAHQMTKQEIIRRFNSPVFTEAAEVLDMIQRTPQQRSQYEARLKAERDERARLQYALEQGMREGEIRGALSGRIKLLSELLGLEPPSFDGVSTDQLAEIESDLQHQLRKRNA